MQPQFEMQAEQQTAFTRGTKDAPVQLGSYVVTNTIKQKESKSEAI